MNHFKECLTRKYADFNGRARRAEFWGFVLGYLAVFLPFYVLGLLLSRSESLAGLGVVFSLVALVVSLALLVPSIAVAVRRLHDRDLTGWLYLIGFVPFVGGLVLLVLYCLEGTTGANRYGPDPKNGAGTFDQLGRQQGPDQFGRPAAGQQPSYGHQPGTY